MIWCEHATEDLSGRYVVDICVVYFDDNRCLGFEVCECYPLGVKVAPSDGNSCKTVSIFFITCLDSMNY